MRRVTLLLLLLGAGCSTGADGSWTLTEMLVDGDTAATPATITFQVDGSRASGSAGCNTYSGDVSRDDGDLVIENVAVTEIFCTDTDVMAAEARYLDELVSNRWTTDVGDTTLVLTVVDAADTRLTFEAP